MVSSPFAGLRVLDWTDGGMRLAGRVLAQLGADVVRLSRGEPGPALRDHPLQGRQGVPYLSRSQTLSTCRPSRLHQNY